MGAFSIFHWIILLAIIGGIVGLVTSGRKYGPDGKPELRGIGGWLAVLAVWQVLITIQMLGNAADMSSAPDSLINIPGASVAAYFELALNLCLATVIIATTFTLFKKLHVFKRMFFFQWLASPIVLVLKLAIVSAALRMRVELLLTGEVVLQLIVNLIIGGLWLLYIRVSVRVKNTMVN